MSHTDHCPDAWTAEREGRRAGERDWSRYSNPYVDECPEASDRWDSGYRSGVRARIEREEEEHAERVAMERRYTQEEEDQAEEQEYYAQQDEQDHSREYQEYCEAQYQVALLDDLHLEKLFSAYEVMAFEAVQ